MSLSAHAEIATNRLDSETKAVSEDHRAEKRLGTYLGILGDPHPTVLGANVAYNWLPFLRASLGFGQISVTSMSFNQNGFATEEKSMTTIGTAAKFMVPGWNLTPTASLGYSHVFFSEGITSTDFRANNIYMGFGGDWQAESGFNMGAGLNVSLNGAAPSAPYLNLGMFF